MKAKIGFALLRVSTPGQSLESQETTLLKIAEDKGYVVPEEYRFREKKTGYDELGVDRDSIIDLRNSINLHKPEAIFILELSRLTRNGLKVYDYIKEFSLIPKIPMYFADYEIWTLNPDTKEEIRENIFKLVGAGEAVENERKRIIARTTRGKAAAAAKGLYAGHLSDGYMVVVNENGEKVIKPDNNRAPIIKRIFELYRTYSVSQIRDILNQEGIPVTSKYRLHSPLFPGYKSEYEDKTHDKKDRENLAWTKYNIQNILGNEWYIGVRRYNGIAHSIEPIITQEDWDFAQSKKALYESRPKRGRNLFMLSGLLYCGNCGRKMYGHYLGLNNHYYCSSSENGRITCNARGISKENIEGIIKKIVITRLLVDAALGVKSPVNDTLSMDIKLKKDYLEKINVFKSIVERNKAQLVNLDRQLQEALLGKITANEILKQAYEAVISKLESQIRQLKSDTTEYEKDIAKMESALSKADTAKRMTERLQDASLEEIKEFFNIVINKVVLYNTGKTTSVVRIHYNNGFFDEFIYSSQRHKGKYFPLGTMALGARTSLLPENVRDIWWAKTHDVNCVGDGQSFLTTLVYHPEDNQIHYNEHQTLCFDDQQSFFVNTEAKRNVAQYLYEHYHEDIPFNEISGSCVSVEHYITLFEKDERAIWDYEKIEGLSERAKELQNYAKEYRKKYNTGRPSSEPFITKDEQYAAVQVLRKRIYNRIYKIKKNKSISERDKQILIAEARKQLHNLKYRINYFGDSMKAKKYSSK